MKASSSNLNISSSDKVLSIVVSPPLKTCANSFATSTPCSNITLSLLDNKLCYNIVKSIQENKESYNNVAQLLEFIGDSPEERNLVAALAVDIPEKENELIILKDCIKTLEDISTKKEISQIRNQIRIAEDNNQNLDTSLIRKLEELQKKVI